VRSCSISEMDIAHVHRSISELVPYLLPLRQEEQKQDGSKLWPSAAWRRLAPWRIASLAKRAGKAAQWPCAILGHAPSLNKSPLPLAIYAAFAAHAKGRPCFRMRPRIGREGRPWLACLRQGQCQGQKKGRPKAAFDRCLERSALRLIGFGRRLRLISLGGLACLPLCLRGGLGAHGQDRALMKAA
jgi:hypothetical protein